MRTKAGHMNQYDSMFSFGKRHVAGADHERDQEVAERAGQDRDDHEEDHHRGVHREQHVVELGRHACRRCRPEASLPRIGISACGQASCMRTSRARRPPMTRKISAGEQELNADDLVIVGEDVLAQEAQFVMMMPGCGGLSLMTNGPHSY